MSIDMRNVAHGAASAVRSCPFDLVARAFLALDGCLRLMDPHRNGQPFAYAELHTEPPVALHAPWDHYDVAGRLLEALTLCRVMTGTAPDNLDEELAALLRVNQREDGLVQLPPEPWAANTSLVELEWSPRAALLAWTTRILAVDDRDARTRADRLVHALAKTAVWEADTCWFPATLLPETGWKNRSMPQTATLDCLPGAQLVFPLARYAECTGSDLALRMAHGFIRGVRERSGAFEKDGTATLKAARYLHSNLNFILGVLKYGLVARSDDDVSWAQSAYDRARDHGTDFGFFPRHTGGEGRVFGDTCALSVMIEIAILLALHRDPRYFADAERYGRNHLLESQFVNMEWLEASQEVEFCDDLWCANHPTHGVSTDEVSRKSLGGFAGWSQPNDCFDAEHPRLNQRCSGSGLRALYALWHYSITKPEGAVRVNMHFSRDSKWATVTSRLPVDGSIEVTMKSRGVLTVRVPDGLTQEQVAVTVNFERGRSEQIRGGLAWIEALQQGDVVSIAWPLNKRSATYALNGLNYTGEWRGETLVGMSPMGRLSPLYERNVAFPAAPALGAVGPVREIDTL